jgi:hypothetical protein
MKIFKNLNLQEDLFIRLYLWHSWKFDFKSLTKKKKIIKILIQVSVIKRLNKSI